MRNDIKLYIGDREVDGIQGIDILFTKEITDYANPTVVQNSYSKTVTIPGTKNNNDIFGHFWRLDRVQEYNGSTGPSYNPSYRVPFTLYVNGDVYESGYIKLDEITRHGRDVQYSVSLFGGLGQFFYNLDTDWNTGEKKKLSDVKYMSLSENSANEFDMTMYKDTIEDFWAIGAFNIDDEESQAVTDYLNFAPCYNGIPENLSADKVLINMHGNSTFASGYTSGSTTYSAWHGFSLGKVPEEMTEWETKDLRSYNQRPVLSIKRFFEAIARPENNKGQYDTGYTVDLSDEFFNPSNGHVNPLYHDAVITLPLLSDIDLKGADGDPHTWSPINFRNVWSSGSRRSYLFQGTPYTSSNLLEFNFEFGIRVFIGTGITAPQRLYCTTKWTDSGNIDFSGWAIQLVLGNTDSNAYGGGTTVGQSDMVLLTSSNEGQRLDIQYNISKSVVQVAGGAAIQESDGYFVLDYTEPTPWQGMDYYYGYYKWYVPITLRAEVPPTAVSVAINITETANLTHGTSNIDGKPYITTGDRERALYPSKTTSENIRYVTRFTGRQEHTTAEGRDYAIGNREATWYTPGDTIFTGSKLNKAMLLNTDYSPCDLLLSYCKMFGLYLEKDKYENIIYIKSRKSFYERDNITNIESIIDNDKPFKINPIVADAAFYNLTTEAADDSIQFIENYSNEYGGKTYGMKSIKTGYNFDAAQKELLEDACVKGTVDALEKGRYYYRQIGKNKSPYVYVGVDYELPLNGDLANDNGYDMRLNPTSPLSYEHYNSLYPSYDLFVKPQFHDSENKSVDGSGVLLIYNGHTVLPAGACYWLTDDVYEMGVLNDGDACWIYTESEYDNSGNRIAIRYATTNGIAPNGEPCYIPDGTYTLQGGYPDLTIKNFKEPYIYGDQPWPQTTGATYTINSGDYSGCQVTLRYLGQYAENATIDTITASLPLFQRYRAYYHYNDASYASGNDEYNSGFLTHSMDFGDPRKLYVPFYVNKEIAHIYHNYWDSYLQDLYDINTKRLTIDCHTNEIIDDSWFHRFYWFENTIWRLNKINDYDVSSDKTVSLEFIKVEDINDYTNKAVTEAPIVGVELFNGEGGKMYKENIYVYNGHEYRYEDCYIISPYGGTYQIKVNVSDGGSWYAEYDPDFMTTADDGHGDAEFEAEMIPYSPAGYNQLVTYTVMLGDEAAAKLNLAYRGTTGHRIWFDHDSEVGTPWHLTICADSLDIPLDCKLFYTNFYQGETEESISFTIPVPTGSSTYSEYRTGLSDQYFDANYGDVRLERLDIYNPETGEYEHAEISLSNQNKYWLDEDWSYDSFEHALEDMDNSWGLTGMLEWGQRP